MYQDLQKELNAHRVTLVAVSKTHPPTRILELYQNGQRIFGENRVQELLSKVDELPSDIEWHLIGHLQTNKVRQIAPFIQLIQSVDSLRLLNEIDKQAKISNRVIDCLLQFHVAQEASKFGLSLPDAYQILDSDQFRSMHHVRICGVMGMATFTDDTALVRKEFQQIRAIFQDLKNKYFQNSEYFKEISMGMSSDWEIAVEEGSTMVRIGSLLFGDRT